MATESSSSGPHRTPTSTYRLQLNLHFTFRDARRIVPYLADLGITDLYASPYLRARPGSLHGYDISNHDQLNPEIGGEEEHTVLVGALRENGMGQLLDIVPNHMGVGESTNNWWLDVLENGPGSPYAKYFDVDWEPLTSELAGKVLLPVLGDQFGIILERGELRLEYDEGRFRVRYGDNYYPIAPRSSALILRSVLRRMMTRSEEDDAVCTELESVVTALQHLPSRKRTDQESIAERRRESLVSRRRLNELHRSSQSFRSALEEAVDEYNGVAGEPHSFDSLADLLEEQSYRLAYWRVATEEINYRRFFDVNDLAGIRVERGDVFQAAHKLIFRLMAEGKVTALRVDHPDGLFDPAEYLRHLRSEVERRTGNDLTYVVVEKILTGDESLPEEWPVAGTVGYDFLNRVNGLFVANGNADEMLQVYSRFISRRVDFEQLAYEKKKLILRVALASELNVLAYHLNRISESNRRVRDFTLGSLTDALRETLACFPVYRTYVDARIGRVKETDTLYVEMAIRWAIRRNRSTSPTIFEFIRNILLLKWPDDLDAEAREEHALFVMKFQQLTGPVMAKAVEDTSFYIDNRLVSLNEVGGSPLLFGADPPSVHQWLAGRARDWPLTMNASTTHDTKRSEDVRARINVLSEIPATWEERARRWADLNASFKETVDDDPVPDANDEYLLYQTLVGVWPLTGKPDAAFVGRVQAYMEKATREAKVHTSWINPNTEFDDALGRFIGRVLDASAKANRDFLDDFLEFHQDVAADGMVNSLGQTLIKLLAPGVPDLYQGQEIWDFSLVDPDNRRPVDFELREKMLAKLKKRLAREDRRGVVRQLLDDWRDGAIKLMVTHIGLQARTTREDLVRSGRYQPLDVEGERERHVFGFARATPEDALIVVVPRLVRTFRLATGKAVYDPDAWGDTRIRLPSGLPGARYRNAFTGCEVLPDLDGHGRTIPVERMLGGFPVALLERAE